MGNVSQYREMELFDWKLIQYSSTTSFLLVYFGF